MASESRLERLTIRELVVELDRAETPIAGEPRESGAALREQAIIAELHRRGARASAPATAVGTPLPEGHP